MGKALRIPYFYITKDYPMHGDVIMSDPDDESTSQNITRDQLQQFNEFREVLKEICAMRSIRIDFPDGTLTEKFEWWFDLSNIDRAEKEMLNTKDFKTHPLIQLASLLNFEIPVHEARTIGHVLCLGFLTEEKPSVRRSFKNQRRDNSTSAYH